MEEVFRALADPSRRLLLDRLFERDGQTLTELEAALPTMTRFGVMKHLRVLEEADLVTARKVGREKHHYLNPVPIRLIHDRWLDKYTARAAEALLGLKRVLEQERPMAVDQARQAPPTHVFHVHIRTSAEDLWRAITESDFTLQYFFHSTVESDWTIGAPIVYSIEGQPVITGEIVEADPPRRLVTTFNKHWDPEDAEHPDPPSRVTWEIEPGEGSCLLTVVHDGSADETGTFLSVGNAGGWPLILSSLKSLLETGRPL